MKIWAFTTPVSSVNEDAYLVNVDGLSVIGTEESDVDACDSKIEDIKNCIKSNAKENATIIMVWY